MPEPAVDAACPHNQDDDVDRSPVDCKKRVEAWRAWRPLAVRDRDEVA
jgi:hypothetical protein